MKNVFKQGDFSKLTGIKEVMILQLNIKSQYIKGWTRLYTVQSKIAAISAYARMALLALVKVTWLLTM